MVTMYYYIHQDINLEFSVCDYYVNKGYVSFKSSKSKSIKKKRER